MFSTPETSVHVRDKNREISPLEGKATGKREGYGGNKETTTALYAQ